MKHIRSLRMQLTIGVVAMLTVALALCSVILIGAGRNALLDAAVSEAVLLEKKLTNEFHDALNSVEDFQSIRHPLALLRYHFIEAYNHSDSETEPVLQYEAADIYNSTGIDPQAMLKKHGKPIDSSDLRYLIFRLNGRDYCVVGGESPFLEGYTVSVVHDITSEMDKIRTLTLFCILICAVITLLSGFIVTLFLAHSLHPVKVLQESAAAIAEGQYTQRIQLDRRDELGELAQWFNAMADSVQHHIEEVEATSEARSLFLHALAHEMRTPVTAISGYAYTLNRIRMSEEQQMEALTFIESESKRLERLSSKLTELLSISKRNTVLQPIFIADLFDQISALLQPIAEKKHIILTLDFDRLGWISGDSDLLVMLTNNLFDNALKAGAAHITVRLRAGVLSVTDDGHGIPSEIVNKIMQPFYQGDSSRNQEGFGLGLTLCQKIAQLHGGTLEVKSTLGQGSVFTTLLQVYDDSITRNEIT